MSLTELIDQENILLLIVDIALVSFIFYRAYLLLNRTRATQLLIGVAIILVVDVLARQLELTTLSWLITNVSSYLVFGLIVLLQPELRRLISEIGQMPLFQWLNQTNLQVPLDPIVDAVRIMAGNKVGSIICILRQNRPESIIENAVRVNGQISSELLQTIFHKDTALHDGAVLIENDRIIAASCYLPLSNSRALKRTHGARHRAAMGFSEETDSLVIVTSEETGRISVLLNGELKGPLKPMELKEIMRLVLFESKNRLSELEESQSGETRTTVAAASKKK